VLPVEPAQTVEADVIVELGRALMVTTSVHVLLHPFESVTVKVNVKDVPVPAVTLTD
jgi:hypothetical protein